MAKAREFKIQILFEREPDGRFRVRSPTLDGLHLAGRDLKKLCADLDPIVKDLLFHNLDFVADRIRWSPSLEHVAREMTRSPPPRDLLITGRAA
jgi:hypothetical protein